MTPISAKVPASERRLPQTPRPRGMSRLAFRILLKCLHWCRTMGVRNIDAVIASHGLDGAVRLLASLDMEEAASVLRAVGATVGDGTRICRGLLLCNAQSNFDHLWIGSHCHLGPDVLLDLAAPVRIGDRSTLSMRCCVLTHTNAGDSRCGLPVQVAPTVIEDDAYLGAGVLLLPGVRIGAGSVVAAGAVVTRNVEPGTTVAGCPARLLDQTKTVTAFDVQGRQQHSP